jgi:hypothetical protein
VSLNETEAERRLCPSQWRRCALKLLGCCEDYILLKADTMMRNYIDERNLGSCPTDCISQRNLYLTKKAARRKKLANERKLKAACLASA